MMHIRPILRCFSVAAFVAAQALADGTITQITVRDGQLDLTIQITPGEDYDLQCTTNLTSGIWQDIDSLYSESLSETNLTLDIDADHCWYRVVEQTTAEPIPPSPPSLPPTSPPLKP